MFNLFFRDLPFREFDRSLLLQQGQRCSECKLASMKIPHTEHGLWPATNRNPSVGLFAANLLQIPLHLRYRSPQLSENTACMQYGPVIVK
ncbi:MAG: hypothetical protein KGH88_01410 [Thaumarchaeota archaeon]|nr:hypothetical protein [Nitrososphaerota archaeon]